MEPGKEVRREDVHFLTMSVKSHGTKQIRSCR